MPGDEKESASKQSRVMITSSFSNDMKLLQLLTEQVVLRSLQYQNVYIAGKSPFHQDDSTSVDQKMAK